MNIPNSTAIWLALALGLSSALAQVPSPGSLAPDTKADAGLDTAINDWIARRAASTNSAERCQALEGIRRMARTANGSGQGRSAFVEPNWSLAIRLVGDPETQVRSNALVTIGSLTWLRQESPSTSDAGVILKALKDPDIQVQGVAADVIAQVLSRSRPQPAFTPAIPAILKRFVQTDAGDAAMSKRSELRRLLQYMVPLVEDQSVLQEFVSSVTNRVAGAKSDADRADWLWTLGELQLLLHHPAEAVTPLQQALKLTPDYQAYGIKPKLEQALWAAGRRDEAEQAADFRNFSFSEFQTRLRTLAIEGNVDRILQMTRQTLAGLAAQPPNGRPQDQDQVVRTVTETLSRSGKTAGLEELLQTQLALSPDNPGILSSLARLKEGQNQIDLALVLYEKALLSSPDNGYGGYADLQRLCARAGQTNRFEQICRRVLERHPGAYTLCQALAQYYLDTARTNEARAVAAQFRENMGAGDSKMSGVWQQRQLADLLVVVGDYDGAIAAHLAADAAAPDKAQMFSRRLVQIYALAGKTNELAQLQNTSPKLRQEILQQQLRTQVKAGQLDAAQATAMQLMAMPLSPEEKRRVWDGLFQDFLMGRSSERLMRMIQDQIRRCPDDSELPYLLGHYYWCQHDLVRAIEWEEKAHAAAPEQTTISCELARLLLENGRPARAIEILRETQRLLSRPYDKDRLYVLLVEACRFHGDTNAVEQIVTQLQQRAAAITPAERTPILWTLAQIQDARRHSAEAVDLMRQVMVDASYSGGADPLFLVRLYEKTGKLDEAIAACREGFQRQPGYISLQSTLGTLYERKGMHAEAEAAFVASQSRRLEKINSGKAGAADYNELAWFYITHRIKSQDALALARKAVLLEPGNSHFTDTLAWALLRNGDYAAALNTFAPAITNAAELNPGVALLSRSAWRALTELAQTNIPAPLFLEFTASAAGSLRANPIATARLNLVLSLFHEQRGDKEKAVSCRRASGYPREDRWQILGPFNNEENLGLDRAFIPEDQPDIDRNARYPGRWESVRWSSQTDGLESGVVSLDGIFQNLNWAVAYAWTTVVSDRMQQAELRVGGEEAVKVWLNGHLVSTCIAKRGLVLDENVVPVTLNKGANHILVKTSNQRGEWKFSLRLTAPGAKTLPGVEF